jgi:hypothetical protein
MILHNSWQSHLSAANACDTANRNLGAFAKALSNDKSKNDKINAITEDPDSIVTVAYNRHRVKFVYSCKKFGGTRTISPVSIGGLIGSRPRASPIVINTDIATTATEVKIPPTKKIWHCNNTKELDELPVNRGGKPQQTPNLRQSTCTGHPNVSANKTESTNTNTMTTGEADGQPRPTPSPRSKFLPPSLPSQPSNVARQIHSTSSLQSRRQPMTSMTPTRMQRILSTKTCIRARRTLQIGSMQSI